MVKAILIRSLDHYFGGAYFENLSKNEGKRNRPNGGVIVLSLLKQQI